MFCKLVGRDVRDFRETLSSITLQEEETSTLVVDSEEEDEKEAWVKVEVR
jgi:hypothetical protein